jgi:hypothetical protein
MSYLYVKWNRSGLQFARWTFAPLEHSCVSMATPGTEACDAIGGALRPKWREWPERGIRRVVSKPVAFGLLLAALFALLPSCPSDRHRGGGHPPTPATPPCVRIRTRRFDWLR